MRIKNFEDVEKLGLHARKQISKALGKEKLPNVKRFTSTNEFGANRQKEEKPSTPDTTAPVAKKKSTPSRVMRTPEGFSYCPYPSTDPFVKVHQLLEARYGRYEDGGLLVTEMIVSGGEKAWRFDFALLPQLTPMQTGNVDKEVAPYFASPTPLLLEADGFRFHRSLTAFKNDRAKQTHALKQGFVVKRITNEDVRDRLEKAMEDIEAILSHQRIYRKTYEITPKGNTQSVFTWRQESGYDE